MKIIGGIYKGRQIKSPQGKFVRPTLAKVREAFFDIIGEDITNTIFLDMYAGTGAVGIEALSRGAKQVYFIEYSQDVATLLLKNLAFVDSSLYVVIRMEVMKALARIKKMGVKFDIAYIDPPYNDKAAYTKAIMHLLEGQIMNPKSVIGIEHSRTTEFSFGDNVFNIMSKTYRYGDTCLTILRRR